MTLYPRNSSEGQSYHQEKNKQGYLFSPQKAETPLFQTLPPAFFAQEFLRRGEPFLLSSRTGNKYESGDKGQRKEQGKKYAARGHKTKLPEG